MRLRVQGFSLPKRGNRLEEYEDAWEYNEAMTRLAIADGASDAFESRLWSQALVQAFIREPPELTDEAVLSWLASPIQVWKEGISWDQLPWYAVEKARRGAFATLLGVVFAWQATDLTEKAVGVARWWAMAIGDACFFQIRGDEVIIRFPVEQVTDFGTTPPLLSTRQDYNRHSLGALQIREGECWPGDLFVLVTDALAAWFLQQVEAGGQPWQSLVNLTADEFAEFVERLRREGAMRNDDVTLLIGWIEEEKSTLVTAEIVQVAESYIPVGKKEV